MNLKTLGLRCLGLLVMIWASLSAVAAQNLPSANWYTVLNTQTSDQLIWVNAQGVQATIKRPRLPNEMEGPLAQRQIIISPDGRYGVIAALLNTNIWGLGFYDFQTGAFIQTHTAQPNETIVLGRRSNFIPSLSGVAVGFFTLGGDQVLVTDWRLIHFNYVTGDAEMVLQKSDNKVPELDVGGGEFPEVLYTDGAAYIFALIPYGVGGGVNLTAFEWALQSDTVTGPQSISSELDVFEPSGGLFEARYEEGLPKLETPFDGPIPLQNVLTIREGLTQTPTIYTNSTNGSLFSPRWARDADWYAYLLVTPTDGSYWVVTNLETGDIYTYTDFSPVDLYGTTDGILLNYENTTLIHSETIDASSQPVLYEAPQGDAFRVVYVTPQGSTFTLPTVANPTSGPVQPPAQTAITPDPNCAGAPAPKLAIGVPSRVTYTDGTSLRVRETPGGTIITQLKEGTPLSVTEGPVCLNKFNWWKISVVLNSGSTLVGWAAEGSLENYFMEVFYQDGQGSGAAPLPPAVAVTPTRMILSLPAATPRPLSINPAAFVDGDCSRAPAQSIVVGNTALSQTTGTLAVRETVTAEFPFYQLSNNALVSVIDGPLCHKGLRMWKVQINVSLSGWMADGADGNVYLVKQN